MYLLIGIIVYFGAYPIMGKLTVWYKRHETKRTGVNFPIGDDDIMFYVILWPLAIIFIPLCVLIRVTWYYCLTVPTIMFCNWCRGETYREAWYRCWEERKQWVYGKIKIKVK